MDSNIELPVITNANINTANINTANINTANINTTNKKIKKALSALLASVNNDTTEISTDTDTATTSEITAITDIIKSKTSKTSKPSKPIATSKPSKPSVKGKKGKTDINYINIDSLPNINDILNNINTTTHANIKANTIDLETTRVQQADDVDNAHIMITPTILHTNTNTNTNTNTKTNNLIKKIYHISDLHIQLYKRHDEYQSIFNKVYEYLRNEKTAYNITT